MAAQSRLVDVSVASDVGTMTIQGVKYTAIGIYFTAIPHSCTLKGYNRTPIGYGGLDRYIYIYLE